jgi:hypothetical protein
VNKENVERKPGFSQVCVWMGVTEVEDRVEEFEKFFLYTFSGTRIQYLETILTNPDRTPFGSIVEETGGRSDVFFAVHSEDIAKFAVPRLQYGIRWIEDVYLNGGGYLYPERVAEYRTWGTDECESSPSVDPYDKYQHLLEDV